MLSVWGHDTYKTIKFDLNYLYNSRTIHINTYNTVDSRTSQA